MSYKVLARKWRPRNFAEVAGQEHVIRTLSNAIELGRMHHAYLFTGTRGVGKTTIARILARCLNCEKGPTVTPCAQCSICREIDEGRFIDLVEVDAASRTGVENMRELLDNVQYAPVRGRCKIYLIDEVHMLSISSFNALLKTLEEPPDHMKFFFATTNPQKIPLTILSRCLQLNLTRLPKQIISDYLAKLLKDENLEYEDTALDKIVIGAEGSMRDALSLLDQAIAYGNGTLKTDAVYEMLGLSARESTVKLLQCIVRKDATEMIETIDSLYRDATDFVSVLNDFIDLLHQVALHQALPNTELSLRFDGEDVKAFSETMPPEDVQLAYQIALGGKRDMPLVGDDKNAIEMTLLRIMNFTPLQNQAITKTTSATPATTEAATNPRQTNSSEEKKETVSRTDEAPVLKTEIPHGVERLEDCSSTSEWEKLIERMELSGSVREICYHSLLIPNSPTSAEFQMDESTAVLCSDRNKQAINDALSKAIGTEVSLQFTTSGDTATPAKQKAKSELKQQHQAQVAFDNDPNVTLLKKEFNAKTLPDSIHPNKPKN